MPTDKGHCKHGEFILTEGCSQCIAERQATIGRLTPLEESDGATTGELQINNAQALGNTHPPYCLADGTIVPGVTTVLNILDKPGLPHWAWDLGRRGLDYKEVRDSAARVGTITHHLIASHLQGESPDYRPQACLPEEAARAEKCFMKYLAWEKDNPLVPVIIETPFVSEEYKYGGTPDLLAEINGDFVLIDFKTGGTVYNSHFCQLAAYRQLLEEQVWPVAGARIIRTSPDDSEVEVAIGLDLARYWQIFQHALGIYKLLHEAASKLTDRSGRSIIT